MSLTSIYAIAKSIQPFIKGGGTITPEGVYRIIMTNNHLDFIKQIISPYNLPILIFTAYEIAVGNDDETIIGKIKNNLYAFNSFEFGDTENDVDCGICDGSGEVSCEYCEGNGTQECSECGGEGVVDCPDCDGQGEDEEGNGCGNCEGSGKVECSDCSGEGSVDCNNCSNGNDTCWECDGNGTKRIYNRVPYTISIYVSYDLQQKDELESYITQNKDIEGVELTHKTLTLISKDHTPNDDETDAVDLKFANKTYIGEVIEIDESSITKRGRDKLIIYDLDYLLDKYEK